MIVEGLGHAQPGVRAASGPSASGLRPSESGARFRARFPDIRAILARCPGRQFLVERATSWVTESSRLRASAVRATRSAVVLPSPNNFSKTTLRIVFHRQRQWSASSTKWYLYKRNCSRSRSSDRFIFDRQFERRQRRVLAQVAPHDLIDGSADMDVLLLRVRAAEEHGGGARMVRSGVGLPAPPARGCARLLTTSEPVAEFLKRPQVGLNAKPLPSAAGVQLDMVAP